METQQEIDIIGGAEKRRIEIYDYDPQWPQRFQKHAARIVRVLGSAALQVEHIGSTSVPGLAAKPIIDFCLSWKIRAGKQTTFHILKT